MKVEATLLQQSTTAVSVAVKVNDEHHFVVFDQITGDTTIRSLDCSCSLPAARLDIGATNFENPASVEALAIRAVLHFFDGFDAE